MLFDVACAKRAKHLAKTFSIVNRGKNAETEKKDCGLDDLQSFVENLRLGSCRGTPCYSLCFAPCRSAAR